MAKLKLAIIFGGKSTEHYVSIESARSIISYIDKSKYEVLVIGIDKSGKWILNQATKYLINAGPEMSTQTEIKTEIALSVDEKILTVIDSKTHHRLNNIDVVFPVIHGTFGEDGTLQGLLKALNVPFVGADILGSAIGMDKDVMKRLLRDANIPIARFCLLTKDNKNTFTFEQIKQKLGLPVFIKPANGGSSIGVRKVSSANEYEDAVREAFLYDRKVLVEEAISGRELECGVLGNTSPIASVVGEVIPNDSFYSYEAKYTNADGAKLRIPAEINSEIETEIQKISINAFKLLCCEGLARVDFFLQPDNKIVLNEINTIPGFTQTSMYLKLWEASGISPKTLINTAVDLAIQRHKEIQSLRTSL
jgi:D-alanine-D-alanine ligase